jgi:uncharacterized phage-associated protein
VHHSTVIANRLLLHARAAGKPLTPMQLLKLVFLCHGWMLGLYRRRLVSDKIEAWKYGPVIPALYHAVKHYKGGPIERLVSAPRARLDPLEEHLIGEVYRMYGDWPGPALSHLMHLEGSPWDQIFQDDGWGLVIPNGVIRAYYERQAQKAATSH